MISIETKSLKSKSFISVRIGISLIILFFLFLFSFSSVPMTTIYSYKETDDPREYFYMVQGNRIEQTIQYKKPYVDRMSVCISNLTYGIQGMLELKLHEKNSDEILAESIINLENIQDREFIWFDVKQEVDIEKMYQLDIVTNDVEGELKILCRNQDTKIGETIESASEYGVALDRYLAINIAYRSKIEMHTMICFWMVGIIVIIYILGWEYIVETKNRLTKNILITIMLLIFPFFYTYCVPGHDPIHTKLYFGLAIYYVLLLFISIGLLWRKKISFRSFFIATTLLNGFVYSFVFMPVSSPDETTHYYESYRLSSVIMGQESTDEFGRVLVRKCDLYDKKTQINDKYVIQLWQKSSEQISAEDEKMVASNYPYYIYAPILGYIPQAIGITFARLLHVNYFWLIYFGRLANLIVFALLTVIGISVVPKAKWIVFAICSFPFLLQEVASYSYDTLIIAFSILLGCYVLKLMEQEERVSKTQLGILSIICACMANFKPVYFPLIGLIFLISNKKICDSAIKAIAIKIGIFLLSFIVMLSVYHHDSPLNMERLLQEHTSILVNENIEVEMELYDGWASPEEGIVNYSSGVTESAMCYLLHNPVDIFERIVFTSINSIDWFVLYIFGNYMGGHEIRIPIMVTFLFMFCFARIIHKEVNREYSAQTVKMKSYILLLNCVSIFGLMLVSYLQMSSLGVRELIGIQGRYFYPLMVSLIFASYGKKEDEKEDYFVDLSLISTVHILTLLFSESIIWQR